MSLNKHCIIGRLGKDPEMRYTPSGKAVCTFSVATDDRYKDKDGKAVSNTDWHKCVAWAKLAETCGQYLKKGSQVYVEGKSKTRSYDDKDGVKRYITEIIVGQMTMLGNKEGAGEDEKNVDFAENLE